MPASSRRRPRRPASASATGLPLRITIPGTPVGAARPRVVRDKRTGETRTYMPDHSVRWEEQARQLLARVWRRGPYDGLVSVTLIAWHHRPLRLSRAKDPREAIPAGTKPDIDNVAKLALDAMTKAGVLVDDTRVASLVAQRWYVPIDDRGVPLEPERVELAIEHLAQVPAAGVAT